MDRWTNGWTDIPSFTSAIDASQSVFSRVQATLQDAVLVGPLVGPSVGLLHLFSWIWLFRGLQRLITAPAQPHATEIAVYTALFDYTPSMKSLLSIINNDIIKKFGFHRLIGSTNQYLPSVWHFLYQILSFSLTLGSKVEAGTFT